MSYRYPTPRSTRGSQFHDAMPASHDDDTDGSTRSHTDRVRQEMKDVGLTQVAMLRPESLYLPKLINHDETLKGVVYGHDAYGSVMMVASDQRILHMGKRPHFIAAEEIDYELVSGISYYSGIVSTVILHTRTRDYRVHTFNHTSALTFISYIEERCLDTALKPSRLWGVS